MYLPPCHLSLGFMSFVTVKKWALSFVTNFSCHLSLVRKPSCHLSPLRNVLCHLSHLSLGGPNYAPEKTCISSRYVSQVKISIWVFLPWKQTHTSSVLCRHLSTCPWTGKWTGLDRHFSVDRLAIIQPVQIIFVNHIIVADQLRYWNICMLWISRYFLLFYLFSSQKLYSLLCTCRKCQS